MATVETSPSSRSTADPVTARDHLSLGTSADHYLSFAFDAAGPITSVSEAGPNTIATFAYDAAQRHSGLALGSGWVFGSSVSYGYDAVGRLIGLDHDFAESARTRA
jgi:ABC-type amino acid transport substrate-binding protein